MAEDEQGGMIVGANFIFVHVPKTGGQSIRRVIDGERRKPAHRPLFNVADRKPAFGFVRNPWDRLVSLYCFMCQKTMREERHAVYQRHIRDVGFKTWLMNEHYFMDDEDDWASPGMEPMQRRPQIFWLDGCAHVGRFETLAADFADIAAAMNIAASAPPHVNASRHAHYAAYYDAESRAFVAEHFAPDIERFGYRFQ